MKSKEVLYLIILIFCLNLAQAELNLIITAKTTQGSYDFFAQTNKNAELGFDVYDLEFPPFPTSIYKLYSEIPVDKKLIMDSWSENDRIIKLIFEKENSSSENLELAFLGEISKAYKVLLKDYGTDSNYKTLISTTSIYEGKIYSKQITDTKSYFELQIDYLYCGDGICSISKNESCYTCSNDCGTCSNTNEMKIEDNLNPFYILKLNELEQGTNKTLKIDYGYKFHFENLTYTLKISSIAQESTEITILPIETNLILNKEISHEIDLNNDNNPDIVLIASNNSDSEINLFIKAININLFKEVPKQDQRIKINENISVFDEIYHESISFSTLKIVFPIVLLFVGISIFIFGLFLLLKKSNNLKDEEEIN